MATTTNGIYYPNDYSAVADVPEDMKKMAESIDPKIVSINNSITNIQNKNTQQDSSINNLETNVTNIQAKDTAQDTLIEGLQIKNTELQKENERLREDLNGLPTNTATGESLDLTDSAEMRVNEFKISGNSRQETRSGKNLFDKDNPNIVKVYFSNTGDTKLTEGVSAKSIYIPCKANMAYTIQKTLSKAFGVACTTNIPVANGTIYNAHRNNNVPSITITTSENAKYLLVYYNNGSETLSDEEIFNSIQIEEGTVATEYEPYGVSPSPNYPSEVESCGDNGYINEVVCSKKINDSSKYTTNCYLDNSGNVIINDYWLITDYIEVEPNKKYVYEGIYTEGSAPSSVYYDENKKVISTFKTTKGTNIITTPTNAYYMRFSLNKSNTQDIDTFKISEGQIYTIPTQQPMRKIGGVEDTFVKVDGKWYERHNITELVLTGSESDDRYYWTLNGKKVSRGSYAFYGAKPTSSNDEKANWIMSTHFKGGFSPNELWVTTNIGEMSITPGKEIIFTVDNTVTSVATLKEYIKGKYDSGNPIKFYSALSTPLDLECTPEQVEILTKIENEAKTYKGTTHIYSTDSVKPNVEVKYYKDIDIMINNLQAIAISNATEEV